MELHMAGRSLPRWDARDRVTGRSIYGVDIKVPGMLFGAVLRSSYPHARILGVDVSRATKMMGVKAVLTAQDVPGGRYGFPIKDQTILAREKVRYVGDALALVAARDKDIAEEALGLIKVAYEELPAVFDPEEAMKPEAPIIHEGLEGYERTSFYGRTLPNSNICNLFKLRKGDVAQGVAQSESVFEDWFTSQMVQHCYMEPHAALAVPDASGKVTIWSCTQAPYRVRADLASAFGLPESKIRVLATTVGGGFGGKIQAKLEPYCMALALSTGRPVKMVMSRAEEFAAAVVRHPAVVKIKTGVKKDGTLLATDISLIWDTGAYSGHGPTVSQSAGYSASGPYDIPNVKIDSYCVYTNKVDAGAFRGFGVAQTIWALESQLDTIAASLGMDPLELRLKNAFQDGMVSATGEVLRSVSIKECLEKTARSVDLRKVAKRGRGTGLAGMHKFTAAFTASCAFMKVNEDGTVALLTSAVDIGQGSTTVLAQLAAHCLGLSLDDVAVPGPDTDTTPYDFGTLSSRVTFHAGNAVLMAAEEVKRQLLDLAGQVLEARTDDLELKDKRIYVRGSPEKGLTLAELASLSHRYRGQPILGKGSFLRNDLTPLDSETGQGPKPTEYWKYSATGVDLEIDEETGGVNILNLVAAADAGRAINPMLVEGQIQGGTAMGLAAALWEEVVYSQGKVVNPNLMDYLIPTALDIPRIVPVIVEKPHPDGPLGAKGVGEGSTPPVAPAIGNAVFRALGVRVRDLPLTPEKILVALSDTRRKC